MLCPKIAYGLPAYGVIASRILPANASRGISKRLFQEVPSPQQFHRTHLDPLWCSEYPVPIYGSPTTSIGHAE